MGIATINPATGEQLASFAPLSAATLEDKIALASATFQTYRLTSLPQRAQWLQQAAHLLEDQREALAKLMTLEMGKPLAAAQGEIRKCAWVCRFYAEHAATFLAYEVGPLEALPDGSIAQTSVRYDPLGPILAVMPWNFPFWQVFRFAAPALMAGNVGLLKHASNVPQCALAIESILNEAGFPEGSFQTLLIGSQTVAQVIADDRVKAATLTGSELAGSSLAAAAGQYLKKTVLELGGSDPFIVLDSADVSRAIDTAVTARMQNNGQSCIAAKRFILTPGIADEFEQGLLARFQTLKVGDPMDPQTDLGPLATAGILTDLQAQVESCMSQGAELLLGGYPLLDRSGHYYPPTILSQIPRGTLAEIEEFFGPVALMFRVPDLPAAIELANRIPYGLGASAWTEDPEEQLKLVREIEAGAVFINGMTKSDPRLPFGGIKRSGYGRELGRIGMLEFMNAKTVWIRSS